MAFKTMNRTIDEIERLSALVNSELSKINCNTLSDSEGERLADALSKSYEFFCENFEEEDEEDGDGEDDKQT